VLQALAEREHLHGRAGVVRTQHVHRADAPAVAARAAAVGELLAAEVEQRQVALVDLDVRARRARRGGVPRRVGTVGEGSSASAPVISSSVMWRTDGLLRRGRHDAASAPAAWQLAITSSQSSSLPSNMRAATALMQMRMAWHVAACSHGHRQATSPDDGAGRARISSAGHTPPGTHDKPPQK
jgi:hypothetical protein